MISVQTEPPKANKDPGPAQITAEALLEIVRTLVQELYPGKTFVAPISIDSALDKDLGFDSLGRMELLTRVERAFNISLAEELFIRAETPRQLLQAIQCAGTEAPPLKPEDLVIPAMEGPVFAPHQAQTLGEVLDWHVQQHADRTHIFLYGEGHTPEPITYGELLQGARKVAAGLRAQGLRPGQTVAIMLPTSRDYFFSFFGILLAGGRPAPIYPPARPSQIEDHLRRHARILANATATLLITVPEGKPVARLLKSLVEGLRHIVTVDELRAAAGEPAADAILHAQDIAFLQYTSGSTGNPKGVVLTHANLLANLRAMGEAVQVKADDVFVSWLPLYHDMGLIGAWFGSLYFGFPLVLMSPLAFLAHPHRWLWALHHHRGTLSAAPNFAYELCLNKVRDSDLEGLDLSSWRMAFNGAEPVSPQTIRRFTERFSPYGFRPETMAPVFGLAESAVGLAFPPPGRKPPIDRIQRRALEINGKALSTEASDTHALEFVACGRPLTGHEIRIVDPAGRELPERHEGRLQFRGPSTTSGYFRNPAETQRLFDGEWLDSGDLAYMADGDLYMTSRVKDLIIRAGRNIYPYEVEEAVGDIEGIRKGCVAVFGSQDAASATERVVVLAETRETDPNKQAALRQQVHALATDLLEMPPDEVVLAPPHTVLKTSSGKIRRTACRELFEQDRIGESQRAVWWQVTRLTLASLLPRLRRSRRVLCDTLYAGYAWFLFWCLAPAVWVLTAVLPRLSWRWRLIRYAARLLARLAGIPMRIKGLEHLPQDSPYVLVANHASYLDGMILAAILPVDCRFVAKAELMTGLVPRLFLNRIGSEFVERIDHRRGLEDQARLKQMAQDRRPLMFFPEGTFKDGPGLLTFHMGAFSIAAEAGIPVVPVVIRGSRSILRGRTWFPRKGGLSITVETPLQAQGSDWAAAIDLRDRARTAILRHCGEPDLGHETRSMPQ